MSRIDEIREGLEKTEFPWVCWSEARADVEYLLARVQALETQQLIDRDELILQGKATDMIWLMDGGEEPHTIGIRLDDGDSGVVYVTPEQAKDLAGQLLEFCSEAPLQPEAAPGTTGER
jgi:hypothetical protein